MAIIKKQKKIWSKTIEHLQKVMKPCVPDVWCYDFWDHLEFAMLIYESGSM